MLLLALLLAQPLVADEALSALACTFDSALAGRSCLYEAAARPGDERDNSKLAADAGLRACAAQGAGDDGLRKDCEKAVADASLGPKCAIRGRLADEKGRLTPQAQDCVEAVRAVISRTTRAAAHLDCCRCLAQSHCGVPASQCRSELADLMPGPALSTCLAKSCSDTCPFVTPAKEQRPPKAAPDSNEKI